MKPLVAKTKRSQVEVVGRLVIRATRMGGSRDPSAGKHSVRHSFDMPVHFPAKVIKIIAPLFNRVIAEVNCEERSWTEWSRKIKRATGDELVRANVANIAWWDFGQDLTDNPLFRLAKPLPQGFEVSDIELERVLEAIGYPTPGDRVRQLPVQKKKINKRLAKLGAIRPKF